jgi:cytochrome c553
MQRAHRLALAVLLAAAGAAALAAETQPAQPSQTGAAAQPSSAPSAAGAAPAGHPLAWSAPVQNKIAQCQGCHGIEGWRTAFPEVYHVPKLGGQKPEYIVAALKAYQSGERSFATMRAIASQLSEEDMQAIAKYYGESSTNTAESK